MTHFDELIKLKTYIKLNYDEDEMRDISNNLNKYILSMIELKNTEKNIRYKQSPKTRAARSRAWSRRAVSAVSAASARASAASAFSMAAIWARAPMARPSSSSPKRPSVRVMRPAIPGSAAPAPGWPRGGHTGCTDQPPAAPAPRSTGPASCGPVARCPQVPSGHGRPSRSPIRSARSGSGRSRPRTMPHSRRTAARRWRGRSRTPRDRPASRSSPPSRIAHRACRGCGHPSTS